MRDGMRGKQSISQHVAQLPLFLLIFGLFSASMIIPAIFAVVTDDLLASRSFFYACLLGVIVFAMIAVA
ncbi:MAG: potassium transporter TrkH, partial [Sulfitobacter sp.]